MKTKKHVNQKESCPIKGVLTLTHTTHVSACMSIHTHTFTVQQTTVLPMQSCHFPANFQLHNLDWESFVFSNDKVGGIFDECIWQKTWHTLKLVNNLVRFHTDLVQQSRSAPACLQLHLTLIVPVSQMCSDTQKQFYETWVRHWMHSVV